MEMSEVSAEEIFEITDSSINVENLTVLESSKRRYSELEDDSKELTSKKFKEEDSKIEEVSKIESETDGNDVTPAIDDTANESEINETIQSEAAEEEEPTIETSVLDKTNDSEMLEEIDSEGDDKNNTIDDDSDGEIIADNGHSIDSGESDIEEEIEDEESSASEDDDDDDALMMRAMNASKPINVMGNDDEPIALDSDSEVEESRDYTEDVEEEESREAIYVRKNPFPISYRTRMLRYSPRFYLGRKLLKRSIKIINTIKIVDAEPAKESQSEELKIAEKPPKETQEPPKEPTKEVKIVKEVIKSAPVAKDPEVKSNEELPKEQTESLKEPPKEPLKEPLEVAEPMEVEASDEIAPEKQSPPTPEEVSEKKANSEQKTSAEVPKKQQKGTEDVKSSQQLESEEIAQLLTEISQHSIDDIMSRYVFSGTDGNQHNGTEDFAEKLFICLQTNKQDIQHAQQVWNEKLHAKYKIRELMERIRRHRAVVDIESFGYKPAHDNPIVSSKSSTTNSENDHFEKSSRMSTESVSRLIQDVRANVLKREEAKQRIENHIGESAFDESNPFAQLQGNQGRQGQIIDVQSIINDFRQKNPQEIPRRGRRFKNSFGGHSSLMEQSPYSRMEGRNNESMRSNSSGFPEVSLLPVNSFYKNLSQSPGNSFGQKSSLLQSILTKSTKSPAGLQHMNHSSGNSSTLARLLTAPERERTLQNASRQMSMGGATRQSNGEITITPIQPGTSRKQEYSMEDDENSTDGHLVIDESDFDMSDRKSDLLLCQGCRRHKALFMCAGCSKQWYCSKECQELAWDDHAESCMV